ncbi:MAG TPA: hypothetical protein ENK25_05690 [Bacteroidetes bacterium]|nr:hypothetical protein [Bacteroidota bacterium]
MIISFFARKIPGLLFFLCLNFLLFFSYTCVKVQPERILKVTVVDIYDTAESSVKVIGEVIDIGNPPLRECGFCLAEHSLPGFEDQVVRTTSLGMPDTFVITINGLESGKKYYIRAYAKDQKQTVFSNSERGFITKPLRRHLPRITTDSVTRITDSSAVIYGHLLEKGDPVITKYGIVWSEKNLPDYHQDLFSISEQPDTGVFSFMVKSLNPGTRYYVRTWAMNSDTLIYGQILSFKTLSPMSFPQVSMTEMVDITHMSVIAGGKVINPGHPPIMHYGHCWSVVSAPTADLITHTDYGETDTPGEFISTLDTLTPDTKYYIRAYAITEKDTVYSSEKTFYTYKNERSFMTDARDGQRYAIVHLGDQWWMAENLNFRSADSCWYYNDDSLTYAKDHGRLYNYESARNACPAGWHLPTDDEWKTLETYLGMSQTEADKDGYRGTEEGTFLLKTFGNTTGFDAVYSGYRNQDGKFYSLSSFAYFWTSSTYPGNYAWFRFINNTDPRINRNHINIDQGFSVRCVMDAR